MTQPRPHLFFALTCALSVPFWVLGALAARQLLPGLPISAVMALVPAIAAGLMVYRQGGAGPLWRFLARSTDFRQMTRWAWIVALGTMPLVMVLSAQWLIASGQDLPAFEINPVELAILAVIFFIAATTEELGWSGYAAGPLYKAHGFLIAGAILAVWAVVWHVIPLLQADRAWDWIMWWALGTAARRIIIVWLYIHGGQSVFSTSLFHASSNVSWMMFPVMGSHYDPRSVAIILVAFAVLAIGDHWRRAR